MWLYQLCGIAFLMLGVPAIIMKIWLENQDKKAGRL
jgi:hypothetical protein